jgi:cyclopropane fatty-acyl-phospholipid synthase-like methyltransferase
MADVKLEGQFAAAVVWDSLFHVERERHREIFRLLSGWLEPGGRLLLSAGGSGDEGFTSEMFGQEFFYSGWEPEQTLALLHEAGFEVRFWEVDEPSSRGHIAVVARRQGEAT